MRDALRAPPWGNLWRHLVTTYLFFLLLAIPVAVLTDLGEEFVTFLVAAIAYVLAAIVVLSDVPWPGDPK